LEQPPLDAIKRLPVKASFIEPMLLERANELPEGAGWLPELKLDGYRRFRFGPKDDCLRSESDSFVNASLSPINRNSPIGRNWRVSVFERSRERRD
jgi:hypothetical protein